MPGVKLGFIERVRCPVCGSGALTCIYGERYTSGPVARFLSAYYGEPVSSADFGEADFRLDRCDICGFVFQRQVLDAASSAFFYEQLIDAEHSLRKRSQGGHDYYSYLAYSVGTLQSLFPDRRPADLRVLDFGMGWGHWLLMAKAHGFDAHGVELSKSRVAYAESLGLSVTQNLEELSLKFHVINLDQVLEHVDDAAGIIEALAGKLEPDGVFRIFVPNAFLLDLRVRLGFWRPGKDAAQPLEHINSFTSSTLARLLARFGLRRVGLTEFAGLHSRIRLFSRYAISHVAPSWYFRRCS